MARSTMPDSLSFTSCGVSFGTKMPDQSVKVAPVI
jgi:hypothetical protein